MDKFALIWVDRYTRYFISNLSYLKPGMPFARDTLRNLYDSPNPYPLPVEFEVNQPWVAEIYYSIYSYVNYVD